MDRILETEKYTKDPEALLKKKKKNNKNKKPWIEKQRPQLEQRWKDFKAKNHSQSRGNEEDTVWVALCKA